MFLPRWKLGNKTLQLSRDSLNYHRNSVPRRKQTTNTEQGESLKSRILHLYWEESARNILLPTKIEQTECSETSAHKIQRPGNYPEENIQHTEHSESLKSRILHLYWKKSARHILLPTKMEETECSETSAHKIQTPGNYPEENIQHTEHGESLKSRILHLYGEESARYILLPMKMEQTVSRNVGT